MTQSPSLTHSKMLRALAIAAALLATANGAALAKQKTFKWVDGMCEYSIRYDTKKMKEAELRDTSFMISEAYGSLFVSGGFVSTPQDIEKLDLKGLQKQCSERLSRLESLKLLDFAGRKNELEAMRKALIARQAALCDYEQILTRSYKTPSALREYTLAPQCSKYVDAIENDAKTEAGWRAFVPELCANNASTEDCTNRELKKATLPDAKAHMRITLTAFAWNNCAIGEVWHGSEEQQEKLRDLAQAFQKSLKAKETCEEP